MLCRVSLYRGLIVLSLLSGDLSITVCIERFPTLIIHVRCTAPTTPLGACGATPCGGSRPPDSCLSRSERLGHADGASTRFIVASDGVEGYGHDGPGVCLGDGKTEAEGVPSQGGRGDALLRRTDLTVLLLLQVTRAGGANNAVSR